MDHAKAAKLFNRDEERTRWHDETLWRVRTNRDNAAHKVDDWEKLREAASQIKSHTLSNLDQYLVEFETKAKANGFEVHWASDAEEHNEIIYEIIRANQIQRIVKSKSMLTEECRMNEYLTIKGIEVVDTDLGERIVQFRKEHPSHIVLPAIHLKREDIGETFHQHLGTEKGATDPQYLTEAARQHLREKFITAQLAITGVNFALAETGGFVICTNEGNADMGTHLAKIHIASMGIEKIIPKVEHLAVFLRLLARSATGQPITTYSSHFHKPHAGQKLHIVIVDNGRSAQLGRPDFRDSLKCIRCGACFNTCPVYRRSGGHSYHNAVAGPIGSVLAPNLNMRENADLPFASTLCGSCTNVCPVKINLHDQLWKWRQILMKEGYGSTSKKAGIQVLNSVLSTPGKYDLIGKIARVMLRAFPWIAKNKMFNPWYRQREMPAVPRQSFKSWYIENRNRS
ncbi:MAG: lactate utilization protein [Cyclobacteriaceae bacterium]|nr:lactate utilization protein [Cyclobacteriaceae bacterium]